MSEEVSIELSVGEALTVYHILSEREMYYGTSGTNKGEYISNRLHNVNERLARSLLRDDLVKQIDDDTMYL